MSTSTPLISTATATAPQEAISGPLIPIGPIVRLQVQITPLKAGARPISWYVPDGITAVPELALDAGGVVGYDGERVLNDVHHRDHPLSRYRGENGISVGFTGHYAKMRQEFGDFLSDGIAGENLLVESEAIHDESEFADGLVIVTASGPVALQRVEVAPPCVEFGKFCLAYPHDRKADADVAAAVKFLHQGTRGFYATWKPEGEISTSPRIAVGDLVYRRAGGES